VINTGRNKATATAKMVNGFIAIPEFEPHEPGSDWNDRFQFDQQNTKLLQANDDAMNSEFGGDQL
jgi:phage/plasmid primase-like uncharacterized protein